VEPPPGPEDALADVISHASTGGPSPSATARALRAGAPALLVGIVCALAAEWTWWLHPHGVLQGAASPAAGFVLGALVLLPPRRWPAPAAVAALAVGLVAARHHAGVDIAVGRAVATVVAALAAALLLRGYAAGTFRLQHVRELCALFAASAVGGALGAAIETLARGFAHERGVAALWRDAW